MFVERTRNSERPTHWSEFAEYAEDQHSLQDEEDHDEDEWYELVKSVQSVCPVVRVGHGILPVIGKGKTSVECNVASTDEECSCRAKDQANRCNSSVIEDLVADYGVHEQNPKSGDDRSNVNSRETNAHATIEWEPANCEDLTDGDDNVADEEELHFSVSD